MGRINDAALPWLSACGITSRFLNNWQVAPTPTQAPAQNQHLVHGSGKEMMVPGPSMSVCGQNARGMHSWVYIIRPLLTRLQSEIRAITSRQWPLWSVIRPAHTICLLADYFWFLLPWSLNRLQRFGGLYYTFKFLLTVVSILPVPWCLHLRFHRLRGLLLVVWSFCTTLERASKQNVVKDTVQQQPCWPTCSEFEGLFLPISYLGITLTTELEVLL